MKQDVLFRPLQLSHLFLDVTELKFLAFSLIVVSVVCGQSAAIAQNASSLTAQRIPTTSPSRLEDIPSPKLPTNVLPSQLNEKELLPPPELPELPASEPRDANAKFWIDRIEVVGSTIFQPEQFNKVTALFVGRELSFAELLQARDTITKLYVDSGYVTSGAFISPQKIKDGVVTIQVLEGSVQEIKVTGNRRLHSSYIRDRVRPGTDTPLNVPRLLEKLQVLRLNPRIHNLSAELQAGTTPGKSVLQVDVQEAKTFSADLYLDNGRSPSVGSFRRGVELREANLLGLGDTLSIGYANTNGSNTIDLNYALPVNAKDDTISFGFSQGWNRVIENPFNVLDLQSTSRTYDFTYRQPLLQTPTQELALGLLFSRQES